ncbi:MAG: DUF1016 family protein [Bdellovibrionales bacterium]|nr:DUF1016 family protein [Bdellovibrionales bacterium]
MNGLVLKNSISLPEDYAPLLQVLKQKIQRAQVWAELAVNKQLVSLHWQIGQEILKRQSVEGWGTKVIDQLSKDLRSEFPGAKGFSARNLKYMRAFAEAWPDEAIVQQAAAQIPWFHNCVLLNKVKIPEDRLWYVKQTIANGWSRNVLVHHIESGLINRQGQATANFEDTLPSPDSDLASQLLKDPYNFEFLALQEDAKESELQKGQEENLRNFMLELGVGFSYVGSQVQLEVGGEDFYLDLLF